MSMRYAFITTFWVVAGLGLGIGQIFRNFFSEVSNINYNLAFSIAVPPVLIFIITIVFICAMIWLFYAQIQFGTHWAIALGLIVGGGASNFCDRLLLNGGVADYWSLFNISTINLPDILIVIGILWAIKNLISNHAA